MRLKGAALVFKAACALCITGALFSKESNSMTAPPVACLQCASTSGAPLAEQKILIPF